MPGCIVEQYAAIPKPKIFLGNSQLNNRGFIDNLHPGETKTIELEWTPDTSKTYTHFNVAAYDPILDPKMPLNYHPSLFPDWHIKHNGHATERTVIV